jgi:hypothetical protein
MSWYCMHCVGEGVVLHGKTKTRRHYIVLSNIVPA